MERKHEKIAGYDVVVTSNGVTTSTASTMKLAVPEFDYRQPNYHPTSGVWRELALAVRDQIMANVQWWDQNTWRNVVTSVTELPNFDADDVWLDRDEGWLDRDENEKYIAAMAAFEKDIFAPACGTSMCAAGWATEIVRADWVVDSKMLVEAAKKNIDLPDDLNSLLFAPRQWWSDRVSPDAPYYASGFTWMALSSHGDEVDEWVLEQVDARGFAADTHVILTVPVFATAILGIHDDPTDLFNGSNSYEYVVSALTMLATIDAKPSSLQGSWWDLIHDAALSLNLSTANL
jgi:hypothetical protein